MPRNSKQKQYDVTFVDVNLTKTQSKEVKESIFGMDELENALTKLCESKYKVTCSYDDYSSCFSAFLIPTAPDDLNAGMILTARGSTPIKAVKQLLYKHYTVTAGAWRNYANPARDVLDD